MEITQCDREGCVQQTFSPPSRWIAVNAPDVDRRDFCSWDCLALYAQERLSEQRDEHKRERRDKHERERDLPPQEGR
jgi:hypothetical protein